MQIRVNHFEAGKSHESSFLAIDPGVNTGMAFCIDNRIFTYVSVVNNPNLVDKLNLLTNDLKYFLNVVRSKIKESGRNRVDVIVIEIPKFFAGSQKSFDSMASNSLMILGMITGALAAELSKFQYNHFKTLTAPQWKGQLGKPIVQKRVQSFFGIDIKNEHVIDALGMILNEMGKL